IPSVHSRRLLMAIASQPEGVDIAIDILAMRFDSARDASGIPLDDELISCGQILLELCTFKEGHDLDHNLQQLADVCLATDSAVECTKRVCKAFKEALSDGRIGFYQYEGFLASLFRLQPEVALDEFLGDHLPAVDRRLLRDISFTRKGAIYA